MAKEIKMPDLGTAVKEVNLLSWLKQEGDFIQRGESLCEVETDKATSELESVAEGILLRQIVPAGSTVNVGQVIAYIGKEGESISDDKWKESPPGLEEKLSVPQAPKPDSPKASPMIRNLAQRMGIDLAQVVGTGPGAQITRRDILQTQTRVAANGDKGKAIAIQQPILTKNQLGVAQTIAQSWQEIVPIHLFGQIGMSAAIDLRQRYPNEHGRSISYDAIFIHAISQVMKNFPRFRCCFSDNNLIFSEGIHIGIAISSAEDLYIPVIPDTDQKSLAQIDDAVRIYADKASRGSFSLEELTGATFTFSNLGMFPVQAFTAIIPPRQSGILTVGRIESVVSLSESKQLRSEKQSSVVLSVDHRFINGRQGAEFFSCLKETVENL